VLGAAEHDFVKGAEVVEILQGCKPADDSHVDTVVTTRGPCGSENATVSLTSLGLGTLVDRSAPSGRFP
jgi:hypothetical protein